MKRTLTSRGAVTLVATAGVTVMLSGVSYAFWSVTGSGTGTGTAVTAQALALATTTPVSGLYPGATLNGSLRITNPNPFPVKVSQLAFGATTASGVTTACSTTGVTFGSTVSAANPVVVPANSSATTTVSATMTNLSEDGCQGATFTANVTATGSS